MQVRYIYSACVVISTPDIIIACDPWFTPGSDCGSWLHYPPLPKDPVEIIGHVDAIYISHIHSDHYDPIFLRCYLAKFPNTELLITNEKHPILERRMQRDGFSPTVIESKNYGRTSIHLIPNFTAPLDHDTAMVVVHGDQSIANMNDNHVNDEQIDRILKLCPLGRPTMAMIPYTGAGPFPQTYQFDDPSEQVAAGAKKRKQFQNYYKNYIDKLDPIYALPFAGMFVLMGPLSKLNPHRGDTDAVELLDFPGKYGERTVVLADGGDGVFDLDTGLASEIRTVLYDADEIQRYLDTYPFPGYSYEREFQPLGDRPIPLMPLIMSAYNRARSMTLSEKPWWLCLKANQHNEYYVVNSKLDAGVKIMSNVSDLEPRWEMHIDERLLFLILTRYYHWEEADGGSHTYSVRVPNVFEPDVCRFLQNMMV